MMPSRPRPFAARTDSPIRTAGAGLSRRAFLQSTFAAAALAALARRGSAAPGTADKVLVGAHPWVYAATQPGTDITPVLEQIFADMSYAGIEAIELMHTALRPDDAVARISALSRKYKLPVVGTSFSGNMWNRAEHEAVLHDIELVIPRLAEIGRPHARHFRRRGWPCENPCRARRPSRALAQNHGRL